MRALRDVVIVAMTLLIALAVFLWCAPGYLTGRGFPLDDAWIHAVYARSIARELSYAYNPGVPAAGDTAPLWPLVLAPLHRLFSNPIPATKIAGFAFHLVGACLATLALRAAATPRWAALAAGILVAVHPDLLAASLSGMEVSLAIACVMAAWVFADRPGLLAAAAACAYAARPEVAPMVVILAMSSVTRERRRPAAIALGGGLFLGFAYSSWIAYRGSGRLLPSTFYAKAGVGEIQGWTAQWAGFDRLLGELAIVDHLFLLAAAIALSIFLLRRSRENVDVASALGASVLFLIVSFALVPPIDGRAFYHQRYVLPAVPVLLVAYVHLFARASVAVTDERMAKATRLLVPIAALGLFTIDVAVAFAARAHKLENDAHNIDDVQVQIGRSLASADAGAVVWAVDAGAIRYFGRTFVVDMIGLNSPMLLRPEAAQWLGGKKPSFVELVPGWAGLDPASFSAMRAIVRSPSTQYTVTSFPVMREHWLGRCPAGLSGMYRIRNRKFAFECAP